MYWLLWFAADSVQLNLMARSLQCIAEIEIEMKKWLHSAHCPSLQCGHTTRQKTAVVTVTMDCSELTSVTVTVTMGLVCSVCVRHYLYNF